jgi:hypothetical protein
LYNSSYSPIEVASRIHPYIRKQVDIATAEQRQVAQLYGFRVDPMYVAAYRLFGADCFGSNGSIFDLAVIHYDKTLPLRAIAAGVEIDENDGAETVHYSAARSFDSYFRNEGAHDSMETLRERNAAFWKVTIVNGTRDNFPVDTTDAAEDKDSDRNDRRNANRHHTTNNNNRSVDQNIMTAKHRHFYTIPATKTPELIRSPIRHISSDARQTL